jgi:hypothetical protein
MKFKYEISKEISEQNYLRPFLEKDDEGKLKVHAALERAWKNRDFEIDKYWSRATYFWTFIAATFGGYFLILSRVNTSNDRQALSHYLQEVLFIIASLGLVFSYAWVLVNRGSKKWQENWEKHIDILEDFITGPLYKTVMEDKGFSVSKVNLLVSQFVFYVWLLLWVKSAVPWEVSVRSWEINWIKFALFLFTCVGIFLMNEKHDAHLFKGYRPFSFRRRRIKIVD